jgi:DNA polymerase I-like protein with 3'-5' exonuclease and polymerase domains
MPHTSAAGARSADERAAVNSAVQGSGADKLKAAMVALQGRLGDGAALPRGTCRLVHSVSDTLLPVMSIGVSLSPVC